MKRHTEWLIVAPVMFLGLVLRLLQAGRTYLNPDEALYFFLALPRSIRELYVGAPLMTDHPPLLFLLMHPIVLMTSSEIALRLIPILAGIIFPWVMYCWLAKVWNPGAGLVAFVILTLSPNLISLGAQMRGYTIELLLAALALYFLEAALAKSSLLAMAGFTISLYLAILSEYSAAWFAGAMGIYFLLRAWQRRVPRSVFLVWTFGQMGALAIYGMLYWTSIRDRLAIANRDPYVFLRGAFPGPHENRLVFGALATVKQFAYAFSSIPLGVIAALLFVAALMMLWRGPSLADRIRIRNRTLAVLLVSPFLLACSGALLGIHPYGRSRHTVILSLFVAAGVGIAFERVVRSRLWLAGGVALGLGLAWMLAAEPDQNDMAWSRDRRTSMIAAISYLRSSLPANAVVMTDRETALLLTFYLPATGELRRSPNFHSQEASLGTVHFFARRYDIGKVDDFLGDLAFARTRLGLGRDATVWVMDGGFDAGIDTRLRMRFPGLSLSGLHDFDGALTVFQIPAGL